MTRIPLGSTEELSGATIPIDVTEIARETDPNAPRLVLLAVSGNGDDADFHVCTGTCPHDGCHVLFGGLWGSASEPIFDDATKVVTCPCHGSRFNLSNGDLVAGPAQTPLTYYETEVEDNTVYVVI